MTASTVRELREAAEITDDEINAAVDVLLAEPKTGSHVIGGGDLINLAAVVEVHELSALTLAIRAVRRSSNDPWRALRSC